MENEIIKACNEVYKVDITKRNKDYFTYILGRATYVEVLTELKENISLKEIGKPINRTHASIINIKKNLHSIYKKEPIYKANLMEVYSLLSFGNEKLKQIKLINQRDLRIKKLEERLVEYQTELNEPSQEIIDKYKIFYKIPVDKIDWFVEFKLKPFFLMNNIK